MSTTFSAQVFGKYFLVDKIATGGMAEIFKAKTFSHGGFEHLLVIKRILPNISENADFVDMFIDEAKVSVALQHPNVVRIYDFGKITANYYIAMECVDGKDVRNCLRKLARRRAWMPPQFCAYIAYEVCKGLEYAHNKTDPHGRPYGVVHRDISPSNVLVAYDGHVKVADFGIAKAQSNAYQTRDGMLKGKFEYMSPEQAQGKEIDLRSDLFSLGIILYETMTGRRLFKTDSEIATLKMIRDLEIVPPRAQKPDLPEELERICMRALSKDPDVRYATAQHMADDLRAFLGADSDAMRNELQAFMQDLFAEEIHDESARLELGSSAAQTLREQMPADWDGTTGSTMRPVTQTVAQTAVPYIAGGVVGILLLFAVAVAGVLYVVANQTGPGQSGSGITLAPDPGPESRLGTLDVVVVPEARVYLNGELKGTFKVLTVDDLEPGSYAVRLEAEGHVPFEKTVQLDAGGTEKVMQTLEAEARATDAVEAPEPAPSTSPKPSGPPRVSFKSTPSGAQVSVDGSEIGTTPVSWSGASSGNKYSVTFSLDGFEDATGTLKARRGRQTFSRTLRELKGPGTLTVTVVGQGWANVYIDGEKLSKTAPFKGVDVTAGSHEIWVENPALGIDTTEQHTFTPGGTVTIRARPQ